MEQMLLIEDCIGCVSLSLTESTNGRVCFRGKFQEANQINKNKRLYPYEVLASNVNKLEEAISGRGLFGELDHATDSIVHLSNASHLITKLWWENNVLMGEGEILNTPSGKVLRSLIENSARIGMSSRGVGNGQVNNEGVLVIGESYKLITFDAVADPSTFAAFQQKVVASKKESVTVQPEYILKSERPEIKTEQKKINPKALASYFGQLMQCKLNEEKKRI